MSRRAPNPAAERAAQNQQTIKSLLKLEANKVCADCKRNKHPRWASWNLGVFVCIRCSGIHRGMGTHISKVKSVDLDSWTDEQLQSVLKWGNARSNKYWEAKLAAAHVPSESKIENFIRTKYELKRWVMDGGIPDPSTLDDEGDDDIPLSVVREKQSLERKESVNKGQKLASPAIAARPTVDLIGGDPIPQRASTAGPPISQVPAKAEPAPPKTTAAKDSLLGLDFLGSEPAAPPRPSSTTGTGGVGGQSRPDLKQSILSLYASAPRTQPQQATHSHSGSFGGMQSPSSPPLPQQSSMGGGGFGGMNDAFSSLSFGGTTSPPPRAPAHDAFAGLGSISNSRSPPPVQSQAPSQSSAFSGLGSGSFFDSKPAPAPSHQQKPSYGGSSGFNGFGTPSPSVAQPSAPAPVPASAALGDLFDFGAPAPPAKPAPAPAAAAPAPAASSVFNLSASTQPKPSTVTPAASSNPLPTMSSSNNWSNADVWGDSNAWGSSDTSATAKAPDVKPSTSSFGSWGGSSGLGAGGGLSGQSIVPGASGGFAPTVAADEEFGGWASSTGNSGAGVNTKPAGGVSGSEDLFSNVWQ